MKIGFDISQTGKLKAGCGYFADSLIQALAGIDSENEYLLYPNFGTTFWDPDAATGTSKINKKNFRRIIENVSAAECAAFWKALPEDGESRAGNPDIIHSNNYSAPDGLRNASLVYTLYDLSFLDHPEFSTEQNRLSCFNGVFEASLRADMIVAISDYSRKKYIEYFPLYPAERIEVAYPASRFNSKDMVTDSSNPYTDLKKNGFWLTVGTLEPRKNLRRLLNAYARLAGDGSGKPLVLAGAQGWLEDDLEHVIAEMGISGRVRIPGYVDDNQLLWLYRNCHAFVYPSLYEGFGLPVLEAMSQGAAVATSNVTSLPEIAGDVALYFDPSDTESIYSALKRLDTVPDLIPELKRMGLQQAEKFSWDATAGKVLNIYARVRGLPRYRK